MKIYLATSWRQKEEQQRLVQLLRGAGHAVYDFVHPDGPGTPGFQWSDVDPDWEKWSTETYAKKLNDPIAIKGFNRDQLALESCEVCIMLLPCGKSAHLELGCAAGIGKFCIIYIPEKQEPELMYRMAHAIVDNDATLIRALLEAASFIYNNGSPAPQLSRVDDLRAQFIRDTWSKAAVN